MLDTGAHLRAGRVGGLLRLTEFAIATGPAMNGSSGRIRRAFPRSQRCDRRCRPTRPKPCCSHQEHLRTFDCRVRSRRSPVTAHEFVPAIDADMVLVTELRAFMLLRPARVLVLLAVLGGDFQSSGVSPSLIVSFSSPELCCLGADTIVASMICPPMAR